MFSTFFGQNYNILISNIETNIVQYVDIYVFDKWFDIGYNPEKRFDIYMLCLALRAAPYIVLHTPLSSTSLHQ
jgi:hypothetical protein